MEWLDLIERLDALQRRVTSVPESREDLQRNEPAAFIKLSGLRVGKTGACSSDRLDLQIPHSLASEPTFGVSKEPGPMALAPRIRLYGHAVNLPGGWEVLLQGQKAHHGIAFHQRERRHESRIP